jgi:hypothetical protein
LSASTNDSGVVAIAGSFRVFIAVVGTIPSPELRAEGPGATAMAMRSVGRSPPLNRPD